MGDINENKDTSKEVKDGNKELNEFARLGLSEPSQAVGAILNAMRAAPPMNKVGVDVARQGAGRRKTTPKYEDVHRVKDHVVTSGGTLGDTSGDTSFTVRVYQARPEKSQPIVIYLHAGGWILGDLEHSDHLCRRMANQMGAVVVNVDYRLAPEAIFPAALDDCIAAVLWTRDHAESIGGDRDCIAIAGESSGGGLAAAVTLELSLARETAPDFLLLLEPALDIQLSTDSWRQLGDSFAPVREQMDWMWKLYAPEKAMRKDPRVSPTLAEAVPQWHPPTLILAAEYDPLRDEAMDYGEKLSSQGIVVSARIEPGLPHAFCNLGGLLPLGLAAFDDAVAEMDRQMRQNSRAGNA